MPIEDVGYRKWQGRRLSAVFSWLIMVWSGVQIARRSLWVRRALIVAWLPMVYLGAGMFFFENMMSQGQWGEIDEFQQMMFAGSRSGAEGMPITNIVAEIENEGEYAVRHRMWAWMLATFLSYPQSFCSLLLIGLLAPPLISRDIRSKAFLIYFSKPIGRLEYLAGKLSILGLFLAFITLVPATGLYLFGVFLSPNLNVIFDTYDLPFRVVLASLIFIIPSASVALMFSSLTTESRYAAFAWFAFWGLGFTAWQVIRLSLSGVYLEEMNRSGASNFAQGEVPFSGYGGPPPDMAGDLPWVNSRAEMLAMASAKADESHWSLLSLYDSMVRLQSWILGYNEQMDFPWPQALVVAGLSSVALLILLRRVSAPVRV
jgi:ABC-2 type transport system permease protein